MYNNTYYLSRDTDNVTMSRGILAAISRHHLQTPLTTLTSSTAMSLSPVFPRSPSNTICQYINKINSAGQVCNVYQTEKAHNYNTQLIWKPVSVKSRLYTTDKSVCLDELQPSRVQPISKILIFSLQLFYSSLPIGLHSQSYLERCFCFLPV